MSWLCLPLSSVLAITILHLLDVSANVPPSVSAVSLLTVSRAMKLGPLWMSKSQRIFTSAQLYGSAYHSSRELLHAFIAEFAHCIRCKNNITHHRHFLGPLMFTQRYEKASVRQVETCARCACKTKGVVSQQHQQTLTSTPH